MAKKAAKARVTQAPAGETSEVEAFLAKLEHPHKAAILAVRAAILAVDPSIHEGIKWNAPSFCTSEYFATFHLRAKVGVQLILHLGAKKRSASELRATIADPEGMLKWLADDRATVVFSDMRAVEKQIRGFQSLIAQWIRML